MSEHLVVTSGGASSTCTDRTACALERHAALAYFAFNRVGLGEGLSDLLEGSHFRPKFGRRGSSRGGTQRRQGW